MKENQEIRSELKEIRTLMAQMTEGLAPGDQDVQARIRPLARKTSPFRNIWTRREYGSYDNCSLHENLKFTFVE